MTVGSCEPFTWAALVHAALSQGAETGLECADMAVYDLGLWLIVMFGEGVAPLHISKQVLHHSVFRRTLLAISVGGFRMTIHSIMDVARLRLYLCGCQLLLIE